MSNQGSTPTDRVREALEDIVHAAFEHGNKCLSGKTLDPDGELLGAAKEALSELDGMVLVPVEPTDKQTDPAIERGLCVRLTADYTWRDYMRDLYKAMIAPYVKGEKE